jgi:hypothetical protein
MNTNPVSKSQLKELAPPEQRARIDQTLAQSGMGIALYQDSSGNRLVSGVWDISSRDPPQVLPGLRRRHDVARLLPSCGRGSSRGNGVTSRDRSSGAAEDASVPNEMGQRTNANRAPRYANRGRRHLDASGLGSRAPANAT